MKVCCLSDMHGNLPTIPDCDLLLLGGDFCSDHNNLFWYHKSLTIWLEEIHERGIKIVGVAGNHDFVFERKPDFPLVTCRYWSYLQDSGIVWKDLNIWGSPWQPRFYDWAFNLDEPELKEKWALIPDNTDILVLHGPPAGYGDLTMDDRRTGSPSLTERIKQIKPKLVVCGHIHHAHGIYKLDDTTIVNAAFVDESYSPANAPIIVEL